MLKKYLGKQERLFMSVIAATCIPAYIGSATPLAKAALITPIDNNSIVAFDTNSSDGAFLWLVDDVNHLFQSSLWYRLGSESRERSVSTLNLINFNQPTNNQFDVTYASTDFEITRAFLLDGGSEGGGTSSLLETVTITNTSANPLDFHLFNHTDFDLTETSDDDTVEISSNTVKQSDAFTSATEVVTPLPRNYEVNNFFNILDALEDDAPTTLTNLSNSLAEDVAYAFQWNETLNPSESFSVKINKSIAPVASVPEPSITLSLLGLISLMILWWLRIVLRGVRELE
ncbi:hypothetical protein NUACC21_62710 [Scytonema sp. NUACC21]